MFRVGVAVPGRWRPRRQGCGRRGKSSRAAGSGLPRPDHRPLRGNDVSATRVACVIGADTYDMRALRSCVNPATRMLSWELPAVCLRRLIAGASVDGLAKQVGMAVVTGILFQHVLVDPA